jgi:hypothetical protein
MADSVYQPIVSDDDTESETPSPQTELPIESWSDYRASLEEGADKSALTTEEAASQRSRQLDSESPEDASQRPITRMRSKGDGPLSLNEAADNIHFSRAKKFGADLREAGFSEAQLNEMSADALERSARLDPKMPPPPLVEGIDEYGRKDDAPLSVEEAARQLSDWRLRRQEAQQAELQELAGEAAQHAQAEAQAQQPQPEPQPQPQAQQTPEQSERQKIAAERQRLTQLRQMDGVEASWRSDYDRIVAQAVQEFPSLRTALPTPEQIEDLRQKDPARFQRLAQYDQALRDRQARIATMTRERLARDQQAQQSAAQERAAARAEQDRAFEVLAAQHIPNWDRSHAEVRAQAKKTLVNAGLSEAEIQHLWTGDHTIDAHSSVLQLVLAKAAQWDLATERARQARQAPVPPVQRPGVYRAPESGGDVRDLQRQLKGAKGREALRIATEITRARRGSGG